MDLETFEWLLTAPGQELLRIAAEAYADHDGDPVRAASAVRRTEPDAERAAAALTQVSLRVKGVAKFGPEAVQMYFTPDALEQATRLRVATHRASRLAAYAPSSVVDLGCSIGGDLIAFARAGLTAAGVDLDPVRVAIARANLAALGLPGATMVADATTLDLAPFGVAFADPARRSGRGRTFNVDDWTPPWSFVERLQQGASVVKVAPGIPHDLVAPGVEGEWVSDDGALKEAVLWSGPLATAARRATVIGDGGLASITDEDDPYTGAPRPVSDLGGYLYEPDDAVIRAGLVTAVAAGVDGGLLDEHIAWVTSTSAFRTPFARSYRVLEEVPYREKGLRAALRERGVGVLAIKTRGVDVVPEQLRRRLSLKGDNSATLVLTRIAGQGRALLVEPL
ncbi:MAG: methyltransferase domain-containing protein [Nocardioides sp.]|uniref:class I SAM-dependent methyltransferase n=1 Tax=Nocardioides sp. TaxID=35761 RepID=UPI003F0A8693